MANPLITPLVISYGTDAPAYYPMAAQHLRGALSRRGIPHEIQIIPSTGDWFANCRLKSKYIGDAIERNGCPLAWCDVDCEPVKLDLPRDGWDVAVLRRGGNFPITAGFIAFSGTAKSLEFARKWQQIQEDNPKFAGDHGALVQTYLHKPGSTRARP